MALIIFIGDILLAISGPDGYHQIFSILVLFYLVPYLWIATKERQQPPFAFVICFFLLLRLYSIVYLNASGALGLTDGGDAASYHIPRAESINGDYFDYLFKIGGDYNGRFTHILLAIYIKILPFFGVDSQYESIHNCAYIANTLITIGTLNLYYKIVVRYSLSPLYARRAVWFLAMNPYFFGITGLPQKEALLFFGLALFAYSLVIKEKRYIFLMLSLLVIAFERIYMVPLLVFIFFGFDWKVTKQKLFLLLLAVLFIEWFIGFETAFDMAQNNQESLIELDGSALAGTGIISNIIRTYFGPSALRHFSTEYITSSLLSLSHYLLFIFYPYIAIKALLNNKKFGFAISSSYLFVLVLVPFHSSFKVLMVVFFGGLFLDKIFPIRNIHTLKISRADGLHYPHSTG
jgi:hypothetical protein